MTQATILTMYDPDRSQVVLRGTQISTWGSFVNALTKDLAASDVRLRILTGTVTSPSLAAQIQTLLDQMKSARWHQYEPAGRDNVREGAKLAYGEYVNTWYDFTKADVVLSLDADFMWALPGSVRYARDFTDRRRVSAGQKAMNRLYAVEATPTVTGSVADHRLPIRPSQIESLARAVAKGLGATVRTDDNEQSVVPQEWLTALVRDLQQHPSATVVIAGDQQPPIVHALVHVINAALGNVGTTVFHSAPVEANPVNEIDSLRQLVKDMEAGQVDVLVIMDGNPVYTAPADLKFAEAMGKVKTCIHWGLYEDETAAQCHWHVPATHELEMWGDARGYDGTVTMMQPLIAPLYDGISPYEVIAQLMGKSGQTDHDIVQSYWKDKVSTADFESYWEITLNNGVMQNTQLPAKAVRVTSDFLGKLADTAPAPPAKAADGTVEVVVRPDFGVWDGRFTNNGWLQEMPKPFTRLTWDNAVLLSKATADKLGLNNEDVVELISQDRKIQGPVYVLPGHADDTATLTLGYGRSQAGQVGTGVGFNVYPLRSTDMPWILPGVGIAATGHTHQLVPTHGHHKMEGRDLVRTATWEEYQQHPDFAHETDPEITLYPNYKYEGYAWGMSIDLTACMGCQACVVACQAENNIPVVGKDQVYANREMQWIRIDLYYEGESDKNPPMYHQPVPCMQCENAPCELVCPVGATVHSDEGLNDMVYNRCVGTRYCSNNCPYKVRRFNFFQYSDYDTEVLKLARNPDVTVRSRGVMEKCTYCVQRINAAKIQAEEENRTVRDGEILTACQQACPTKAIVFGNINDPNSEVTRLKAEPLNYPLLAELNTRPRTTYLGQVRNPNPEIKVE